MHLVGAMPATGLPSTTRGVSPQASVVESPTASSLCQIAGTSSIRIQCSWTFCRSVMSAVSRAYVVGDLGDRAQLVGAELPAVDADAQHEVLVVELVRLEDGGATAVDAGLALGVEAPPAHPAAQVGRVDAGEAAVCVDVLDPGPDVEAVVVLLRPLVGVERLAVPERPLALAAPPAGGCDGGCHGCDVLAGSGHADDGVGPGREGRPGRRDRAPG